MLGIEWLGGDHLPGRRPGGDQLSLPPARLVFPKAYVKPNVSLTDTDNQPFDIASDTDSKVTLVYFGYTHCPDLCPLNMFTAASAIRAMPAADHGQVKMVFVTTDPARDTPSVIQTWLGHFSPTFTGLTGTIAQIRGAELLDGFRCPSPRSHPRRDRTTRSSMRGTSWSTRVTRLTWSFLRR